MSTSQYLIRAGSGVRTYKCMLCGYTLTGTRSQGGMRRSRHGSASRLNEIKQHVKACELKSSPEHQAQMQWARNVVKGVIIPPVPQSQTFCSKQCRKRLSPPRDCPYCSALQTP